MREVREYDGAMRRFLAKRPGKLGPTGQRYSTRDDQPVR